MHAYWLILTSLFAVSLVYEQNLIDTVHNVTLVSRELSTMMVSCVCRLISCLFYTFLCYSLAKGEGV